MKMPPNLLLEPTALGAVGATGVPRLVMQRLRFFVGGSTREK
jgi:hypothetical protein